MTLQPTTPPTPCRSQRDTATPFTVYYVVGRPRSGSTFVGDWIARQLGILNAGEVWQTMREFAVAGTPTLIMGQDRWADPTAREMKRNEILADPFWSRVFERGEGDAYAALIAIARTETHALVDCSKTDEGIARYKALGCEVVVIHTIRAFSTWSRSVKRYRASFGLPYRSKMRLLLGYLRVNRRLAHYCDKGEYYVVPQDLLSELDTILQLTTVSELKGRGYQRHEMFGTQDFSGTYSDRRAAIRVNVLDRLLYAAAGVPAR